MKTIVALVLAIAALPVPARAEATEAVSARVEAVDEARKARTNALLLVAQRRTELSRLLGNGDRAAIDAASEALAAAKTDWKAQKVAFTEAKAALRTTRANR